MSRDILFSINTALPIFLVMMVGWGLRKGNIIDESFVTTANRFVFFVALPIKLFQDVSQTDFHQAFDQALLVFLVAATLFSVLASWLAARFVTSSMAQLGAFVHGSIRGNIIYIGFSLMENMTGSMHPKVPIIAAAIVPLYNVLGVMILSYATTTSNGGHRLRKTMSSIFRNPMILSIGAGLLASMMPWDTPVFMSRTMNYFAALTTPLALVAIGASFVFQNTLSTLKPALAASLMKLIVLPLGALVSAALLGFGGMDLVLVYLVFGVPTATTSYVMTVALQGDSDLAANIVMVTTALSVMTMTLFVFAFKSMGII